MSGLQKTWYTTANRAMDDVSTALNSNRSVLFGLKGLLTGAIAGTAGTGGQPPNFWTVDSSSDGVTASSGDNLGGATFTAAKWVRAAAGSAHSWFVLKSPTSGSMLDGPWYLMVSFGTAVDTNVIFGLSKTAPTGGTITADPTATVQSLYLAAVYLAGTAAAGRCHLVMTASGSFHFLQSFNGTTRFNFWLAVQELVEARSSGDNARVIMLADAQQTGIGTPRTDGVVGPNAGWRGLTYDSTTAVLASTGYLGGLIWLGSSIDSNARGAPNAIDSKVDALIWGYVLDKTPSHVALRGRVPDMWQTGSSVVPGSGTPTAAAPDRIQAGSALIPFSVTPLL